MKLLRKIYALFFRSVATRRAVVFLWLALGIVVSLTGAFYLRHDGVLPVEERDNLIASMPVALFVFLGITVAFGLYRGLWTLFSFRDCVRHSIYYALGGILFALGLYLVRGLSYEGYPRSVLLIFPVLLILWEFGGRAGIRILRETVSEADRIRGTVDQRFLVIGDPVNCDLILRAFSRGEQRSGEVVGIFCEKQSSNRATLRGVRIYSDFLNLESVIEEKDVSAVLFVEPFDKPASMRSIVDRLSKVPRRISWRIVPSMRDVAEGRFDIATVRPVQIHDLLDREPYSIDRESLEKFVSGRKILVSGAGGSIGSEICRQISKLNPASLTLFDVSEFFLFEVERELNAMDLSFPVYVYTGDVKRPNEIVSAIDATDGIDVIYHAAAFKHVDLMERNPSSCFFNNVIGTETIAQVAEQKGVGDFVLVSTDKAVRPTSLMGASKRLAERCIMERKKGDTRFRAVRFGNVLGSSGSVVPIFKQQIAEGGPVTVTSPEVTRFFMTIPEAVELVLAAGAVGDDRRILVLEMGAPVKIDKLAKRMIELSGFVPNKDIQIVYTGLKKGEKAYEELLTDDENVEKTEHDRIWVVQKSDESVAPPLVIGELLELIDQGDEQELRAYVHNLIPGSRLLPAT